VFAFLPLLMLPGDAGKFIRVLPTAIVATVLGSLIVALFVIPFLASRLLKEEGHSEGSPLLQKVMAAIHRYYQPALRASLSRPRTTAWVTIGGSLLLSALVAAILGSSLFPKADTPRFLIKFPRPTAAVLPRRARRWILSKPGSSRIRRKLSPISAMIRRYYNHIPAEDAANWRNCMCGCRLRCATHATDAG
jgi:multidrug efflux pump subunit AcrB